MKVIDRILKPNPYTHIPGKKELTLTGDIREYESSNFVYIPLTNHTSLNCQATVEIGDHVYVGSKIGQRSDGIQIFMHASVSGEVVGIEKKWHRSGKQVPCVKIKNDFKYEMDPNCIPPAHPDQLSREEIVEMMRQNGVVGLGGSGFSTYIKYLKSDAIHTVLINGVECEPYLTNDYHYVFEQSSRFFDGISFLMKAAGVTRTIIAIKKGKKQLKAFLKQQIEKYQVADQISIFEVPDAYPLGWEKVLIKTITGNEYTHLPSEVGFVVSNVGTAIATSFAVRDNHPFIRRLVTISGEGIKNPGIYDIRIGTPAYELIQLAGGYIDDTDEVQIIVGGPMMGGVMRSDDFVLSRGVGGIIVLPIKKKEVPETRWERVKDILYPNFKKETMIQKDEQPCVHCGRCVDHCPTGLQPVLIKEMAKIRDKERLTKLNAGLCVECGMCSYICPSHIEVTEFVRRAKRILK